jgi:hypothetical protein
MSASTYPYVSHAVPKRARSVFLGGGGKGPYKKKHKFGQYTYNVFLCV